MSESTKEKTISKKIMGCDLGTTNSCVFIREGEKYKVVVNDKGNNTTPSVVLFDKEGKVQDTKSANQTTNNSGPSCPCGNPGIVENNHQGNSHKKQSEDLQCKRPRPCLKQASPTNDHHE